ncbi:hypothetical protein [Nocardioides alkalitolerans]|uniref:hypothetical protein n=1 Tax=Nocardioides alkalitolerans TaxID=281714 RepID=UPI0012FC731B|nr:hypothetical protein [Nocardioides alkalitolerans]
MAIAGILIVRDLPKSEYAHYVLAINAVTTISALAEAGVTSTLLSRGGDLLNRGMNLTRLVQQAARFRLATYALATAAVVPVFSVLLRGTGATVPNLAAMLCIAAVSALCSSVSVVSATLLRLGGRFTTANLILLASATIRLAAVVFVVVAPVPNPIIAFLVVNTLALLFESLIASRLATTLVTSGLTDTQNSYSPALAMNARRQIPNSVFYVIQGQALVMILATLGLSGAIAEVAALSRFSLGFIVVGGVISQIFMTSIARQTSNRSALRKYVQAMMAYLFVATMGFLCIVATPGIWLSILGSEYSGLHLELILISAGGLLSSLIGVVTSLNQARAWTRRAWLFIPATLTWLTVLALCLRPNDILLASIFFMLAPLAGLPVMLYCAWLGSRGSTTGQR